MKAEGYFSRKSGGGGMKKMKTGYGKPKSAGIPSQRGDGDPGRGNIKQGLQGNYGKNANVTQGKAKTWV